MNIQSIELKHTNPSMGPHEIITTVTLTMSTQHAGVVNNFLDQAIFNETMSLRTYIGTVQRKENVLLEKIVNNGRQGEAISNLTFYFEEGDKITLNDVYREYSLSNFYPTFTKYMVENGSLYKRSGWNELELGNRLDSDLSRLDSSIEKVDPNPPAE